MKQPYAVPPLEEKQIEKIAKWFRNFFNVKPNHHFPVMHVLEYEMGKLIRDFDYHIVDE